ncbi:MAG: MFS transporter, partial [Planctomycetia bacterium]|nr:MFS transporter [Planctomycetia bacterium]
NIRFYYPVFMVMFLRYGITLEQFGLLNAAWAIVIVLLEVPSGALADLVGRKALLVAAAVMMALEMLLLAVVPTESAWVLPALLLNRVLSGAAEAFASGADEALAFDSLKAAGREGDWPRVLERLMQFGGLATIVAMITGSLVYSPDLFNTVGSWLGRSPQLTFAETFRLPIWLTFLSACGAIGVTLAMREPQNAATPKPVGLLEPFRQTIRTGGWILANPLVLVVIAAGVLFDQPIRQLLVVSSQLYARIAIPELFFGVISAGTAVIGLFAAAPMRRLATLQSPRANFWLLVAVVTVGLAGTALLIPWWGVGFFMLLSLSMRLLMFLQSHYLNQLVDSQHRATVLSFRGLAVNISYGLMSLAFAAAVTAVERAAPEAGQGVAFDRVVQLLPGYFLLVTAGFLFWARRRVAGEPRLALADGFAVSPASSSGTHTPSPPSA